MFFRGSHLEPTVPPRSSAFHFNITSSFLFGLIKRQKSLKISASGFHVGLWRGQKVGCTLEITASKHRKSRFCRGWISRLVLPAVNVFWLFPPPQMVSWICPPRRTTKPHPACLLRLGLKGKSAPRAWRWEWARGRRVVVTRLQSIQLEPWKPKRSRLFLSADRSLS